MPCNSYHLPIYIYYISGSLTKPETNGDRRELLRKVLINGSKKSSKQGMYVARKNLIVVVKLDLREDKRIVCTNYTNSSANKM
jgi:hypothetical protein